MKTDNVYQKIEKNESMLPGVKIAFVSSSIRIQRLITIIKTVFKK